MNTSYIEEDEYVYYRVAKNDEHDVCRYEEKLVRSSLSAWSKNVEGLMNKLKSGKKVFTPNSVFYAVRVEDLKNSVVNRK